MASLTVPISLLEFALLPELGGGPYLIVILFLAWAAGTIGIWATCWYVLGVSAFSYWHSKTMRVRKRLTWNLAFVSKEPHTARDLLGSELPAWIELSSIERSQWLQAIVQQLWPRISATAGATLKDIIVPILVQNKPSSVLRSLTLEELEVGSVPMTIDGVQVHRMVKTTAIDLHVFWAGEARARVKAVPAMFPTRSINATVTRVQFKGVIRLTLGPHCHAWPCLEAVGISFVGAPLVDFKLNIGAFAVDSIPGLPSVIERVLKDYITSTMQYPKIMHFPVVAVHETADSHMEPIGCVFITVRSASHLPSPLGFLNLIGTGLSTFVRGTYTNGDPNKRVTYRTRSSKGSNPYYDSSEAADGEGHASSALLRETLADGLTLDPAAQSVRMQFPFYGLQGEQVRLEVRKARNVKEGAVASMLASTDVLGFVDLSAILLKSTGNHVMHLHRNNGMDRPEEESEKPTLTVTTEYRSFRKGMAEMSGTHIVPSGAAPIPSHSRKAPHIPTALSSLAGAAGIAGLLVVHIIRGDNLMAGDMDGSSDPFVVVRIGRSVATTPVVYSTLSPKFDRTVYLSVVDATKDSVEVSVYDYDRFTQNDLLGKVQVGVSEILNEGCLSVARPYKLDTVGTVTMGFQLMQFE